MKFTVVIEIETDSKGYGDDIDITHYIEHQVESAIDNHFVEDVNVISIKATKVRNNENVHS